MSHVGPRETGTEPQWTDAVMQHTFPNLSHQKGHPKHRGGDVDSMASLLKILFLKVWGAAPESVFLPRVILCAVATSGQHRMSS